MWMEKQSHAPDLDYSEDVCVLCHTRAYSDILHFLPVQRNDIWNSETKRYV